MNNDPISRTNPSESLTQPIVSDSKLNQSQFAKSHSIQHLSKTWVNSPTALKIRKFGFSLMSYITKPISRSTSEYYEFRMKRVDSKLIGIHNSSILKNIFGDRVKPAMNIMRKPKSSAEKQAIAEGKSALKKQLLEELKKAHPSGRFTEIGKKAFLTEGICFGIMVDLALHFNDSNGDPEVMDPLIAMLEKGGSHEAEIYHAAHGSFLSSIPVKTIIENFCNLINNIKKNSSTLSEILPEANVKLQERLMTTIFDLNWVNQNIDNKLLYNMSDSLVNHYHTLLFPTTDDEIDKVLAEKDAKNFGHNYLAFKTLKSLSTVDRKLWVQVDSNGKETLNIPYIQSKMIEELDRALTKQMTKNPVEPDYLIDLRNQFLGSIKLSAAMKEYSEEKPISDPLLNKIMSNNSSYITQKALLNVKGLSMNSCSSIMGHHMEHVDDASYLKNFHKLDPGFYFLKIATGQTGGHAVSVIKNQDDSGQIIDPNGRRLIFKNSEEAKELINKLASTYSQKGVPIKDHPYHELELFKIEKKH